MPNCFSGLVAKFQQFFKKSANKATTIEVPHALPTQETKETAKIVKIQEEIPKVNQVETLQELKDDAEYKKENSVVKNLAEDSEPSIIKSPQPENPSTITPPKPLAETTTAELESSPVTTPHQRDGLAVAEKVTAELQAPTMTAKESLQHTTTGNLLESIPEEPDEEKLPAVTANGINSEPATIDLKSAPTLEAPSSSAVEEIKATDEDIKVDESVQSGPLIVETEEDKNAQNIKRIEDLIQQTLTDAAIRQQKILETQKSSETLINTETSKDISDIKKKKNKKRAEARKKAKRKSTIS